MECIACRYIPPSMCCSLEGGTPPPVCGTCGPRPAYNNTHPHWSHQVTNTVADVLTQAPNPQVCMHTVRLLLKAILGSCLWKNLTTRIALPHTCTPSCHSKILSNFDAKNFGHINKNLIWWGFNKKLIFNAGSI